MFATLLCLPVLSACVSLDYVFPEVNPGPAATNKSQSLVPDNDNDRVAAHLNSCNETGKGEFVDLRGCKIPTGAIEGLKFAPDDVELSTEAKAALDEITQGFLLYPDVILSVTSHTDNRGAAADNLELSKQRLNAVIRYMVSAGMKPQRLQPFAYGESRPRAPNATLEGRERNRRIEINVIESLP